MRLFEERGVRAVRGREEGRTGIVVRTERCVDREDREPAF